jgi:Na+/H+ antiporter NhaD/arsenite permease-like protein
MGGMQTHAGYLDLVVLWAYGEMGPSLANSALGLVSAFVDNIPVMFAILAVDPAMSQQQWLLVTLTTGVGGSMLSIGSAAGVGLMGATGGMYRFSDHLKWSWAIALGYFLSILTSLYVNGH